MRKHEGKWKIRIISKKLERQYIHELIDQNLGIQDNPYLRMSDQYKEICEIKQMLEDGNYNNDQALMEVARVKQTMTSNRRLQITNDPEPSTEIVIASENIEDYATRKSRCPTLRKIPIKNKSLSTKNAIIKLYQENEITYDEAVSKINEYKKM